MIQLDIIEKYAKLNPDGICFMDNQNKLTWLNYAQRTKNFIYIFLNSYGHCEDRIAFFLSENNIELLIALSAMTTLKIPIVGLDYSASELQLRKQIQEIKGTVLIYSATFAKLVDKFKDTSLEILIELENILFSNNYLKIPVNLDIPKINRSYLSFSFSSGTIGYPKAIYRTKSFDNKRFLYLTNRFGFSSNERYLLTVPLFHAAGAGWCRMFLSLGATIVLGTVGNPLALYNEIRQHKVSASLFVPNVLNSIMNYIELYKQDMNFNLHFLIIGGKYSNIFFKKRALKLFGSIINEYYGSSETGINTIANFKELEFKSKLSSVGRAFEGNEIIIVDHLGKILPIYKVGQVAVNSYMNMDGYFSNKKQEVLYEGKRFLVTSDYGYTDNKGYLFLRARNIIDSLAVKNIMPDIYGIEDAISSIPGIIDVAIIQANPIDNNVTNKVMINCAIVISCSIENNIKNKIITQCNKFNLKLEELVFLREIPHSLTGKLKFKDIFLNKCMIYPQI